MNSARKPKLSAFEKRAAYSLASIYSLRMLGLFMILPVFSIYAKSLEGSTPFLIGVAMGAYGLSQAMLQIPFGYVSDRIGRKPLIIAGMLIFALGSVVAAVADNIYLVILGRIIQGSGAVAAVLMAFAADLTREEHRLKVMSLIGASIGFSFALSLLLGTLLEQWIGVDGIFSLTALLAVAAISIVIWVVPEEKQIRHHRDAEAEPELLLEMLKNPQLLRLDIGIFILHMVLTATFLVLPLSLINQQGINLPLNEHWKIYLPTMLCALMAMVPFIIIAETKRQLKTIFIGAILVLAIVEISFIYTADSLWMVGVLLFIFFTAFNLLEASLPSLVSKLAPADKKGTAMGVYSTSQFLGAFSGGVLGGIMLHYFDLNGVFLFASMGLLFWLLIAVTMQNPRYLSNYVVKLDQIDKKDELHISRLLTEITGVAEAIVIAEEKEAFLKVDLRTLDRDSLLYLSRQYSSENN